MLLIILKNIIIGVHYLTILQHAFSVPTSVRADLFWCLQAVNYPLCYLERCGKTNLQSQSASLDQKKRCQIDASYDKQQV